MSSGLLPHTKIQSWLSCAYLGSCVVELVQRASSASPTHNGFQACNNQANESVILRPSRSEFSPDAPTDEARGVLPRLHHPRMVLYPSFHAETLFESFVLQKLGVETCRISVRTCPWILPPSWIRPVPRKSVTMHRWKRSPLKRRLHGVLIHNIVKRHPRALRSTQPTTQPTVAWTPTGYHDRECGLHVYLSPNCHLKNESRTQLPTSCLDSTLLHELDAKVEKRKTAMTSDAPWVGAQSTEWYVGSTTRS